MRKIIILLLLSLKFFVQMVCIEISNTDIRMRFKLRSRLNVKKRALKIAAKLKLSNVGIWTTCVSYRNYGFCACDAICRHGCLHQNVIEYFNLLNKTNLDTEIQK
jgi:hypothetical protein